MGNPCAGAFGSGGFGASPWGSGYGLAVESALQTARNAVDVSFIGNPQASDPATFTDALNPANWTVTARDPALATPRLVQFVEKVDDDTLRVFVDGALDAFATYRIEASDLLVTAETGLPIDPTCTFADFLTFGSFAILGKPRALRERVDLANPQLDKDAPTSGAPLGTLQITSTGDYANERGRSYLRKRVLRRFTTGLGQFFHLPGYGAAEDLKGNITPDVLRRIQTRGQAQILREPDVVQALVAVQRHPSDPAVVIVAISVIDRNGNVVEATTEVNLAESQL